MPYSANSKGKLAHEIDDISASDGTPMELKSDDSDALSISHDESKSSESEKISFAKVSMRVDSFKPDKESDSMLSAFSASLSYEEL